MSTRDPRTAVAALVVVPEGMWASGSRRRSWSGVPVLFLRPGRNVVGRGPGADVVLPYRSLSRRHVCLDLAHGGGWRALDLESTNGTWIGDRRLAAGVASPLRPGDLLRLGAVQLVLVRPDELRAFGASVPLGVDDPLRLPADGMAARSFVEMLGASDAMLDRLGAPFLLQISEAQAAPWGAAAADLTVAASWTATDRSARALGVARLHALGSVERAVVGRDDETAHVVLRVAGVSRSHATLFRGRHGWHVVDLGSRNGTRVDGAWVPPGLSVPLEARSVLGFGDYRARMLSRLDLLRLVHMVRSRAS